MSDPVWEDVNVPRGAYISWGTTIGQHVTGKVLDFSPAGGTDFNDNPCPQVSVELIEAAASFTKDGTRTDFPAGELVVINGGPVSLKRGLLAASPNRGDLIKILLSGTFKAEKGTGKEFEIKIARGVGQQQKPAQQPTAQPPF